MNRKAVAWARQQQTAGPAETAILLVLALESDRHGMCRLSTRTIATEVHTCQATVRRTLDQLRDRGLVSWSPGAGRAPNTYRLPLSRTAVVSH